MISPPKLVQQVPIFSRRTTTIHTIRLQSMRLAAFAMCAAIALASRLPVLFVSHGKDYRRDTGCRIVLPTSPFHVGRVI
jgi:hypothetical protein